MKISIPKPCHENWSEMLPDLPTGQAGAQGRFCLKCTKTVVDFSQKTKDEIKSFFQETTGKVCGRFQTNQLDSPKKTIFPLFFNVKRIQKFAFALYLVFGTFLFTSCSKNTGTLGEPNVEYLKGDVLPDYEEPEFTIGKIAPIDTTKSKNPKGESKN
ncbi:MAG: hypothetical protein V4622_06420 [Bacteroidota bacterium]